MAKTFFDKPDFSPPPAAWVQKAKARAERLAKVGGDIGSLAMEDEAKRKADALAISNAASRRGVKQEPAIKNPPNMKIPDPITLLSDAALAAKAGLPDRLPAGDLTSEDYQKVAEGRAARTEIFRRALNPVTGFRA